MAAVKSPCSPLSFAVWPGDVAKAIIVPRGANIGAKPVPIPLLPLTLELQHASIISIFIKILLLFIAAMISSSLNEVYAALLSSAKLVSVAAK